ncbi:MAG: hypothetical protein ABJA82_15920 [Myxococcales bacterium]
MNIPVPLRATVRPPLGDGDGAAPAGATPRSIKTEQRTTIV